MNYMANQFIPWNEQEIKFLYDNIKRLTYKQMSILIGRSPASIQTKVTQLPIQKKVKKHPVNSNFFKMWTSVMAYSLGFIAADGNICHSGRAHTLHIACDDNDVIKKIKLAMEYEGPIHQKSRPSNKKISYSLRICDPIIFNDLLALNVTERKSLTLCPPENIPAVYLRHFIRGYFDGDGTVSMRNTRYPSKLVAKFYTASFPMARFLHKEMDKALGNLYVSRIGVRLAHQKTRYYTIEMGHKAAVKLFHFMYRDADIFLERKRNKFLAGML